MKRRGGFRSCARFDPNLEMFQNINTLDELEALGPDAAYEEKHPERSEEVLLVVWYEPYARASFLL